MHFDPILFFKDLHQHPELSGLEFRTSAQIRKQLEAHQIRILDLPLETGLVAQIGEGQPVLALRSDIDALPIEESSQLDYSSLEPGRMHACGHDFHASTLLTAALLLKEHEASIQGSVKLIFQPAEEISRGAEMILATGVLDDVERIYGIHAAPDLARGQLGITEGAVTAAVDRFAIRLIGQGAHAATPHLGIDPVVAAAQLVNSAQTIVSRRVNPFNSAVISFTHIEAGQTWNIIPESAFLEGTVRSHAAADRALIENRLRALTEASAMAHELEAHFDWEAGPPATVNHAVATQHAIEIGKALNFDVQLPTASMIGEDFAYYAERIPACFIMVGTGLSQPLHNPTFAVDPEAIQPTAEYLFALIMSYFQHD